MAKEKIEVEIVPEVSAASKRKMVEVFSLAAGGEKGGSKAQAFASTFMGTGGQGSIAGEAAGAGAAGAAKAIPWVGIALEVGGKLKEVFSAVLGFAEQTLAKVTAFVAVSNPALVERLGVAFADIYGIIGESLEPVIETLIPMVQDFGDFIASIIPSASEINGILEEMKPLWADIVSIMKFLAPTLKDMISNLVEAARWIVKILAWFGKSVTEQGKMFAILASEANVALGGRAGGRFERTSRGASAAQARFVGIGEAGRNLQLAAASIGASHAARTAEATESIDKKMDRLNREWGGTGFPGAGGGGDF